MRALARKFKKASVVAATVMALVVSTAACSSDDESNDDSQASASESPAEAEAPEPDLDGVPDVVAEVNGEEISKDQFVESYTAQFTQQAQQSQMTGQEVDQDALKKQVLDTLVDRTLLVSAASERNIEASKKDVDEALAKIAEQNGLGGPDEALAKLAEQGIDEEEARSELTLQVQVEKMIEAESGSSEPTAKEVRAYYQDLVEQQEAAAQGQEGAEGETPPAQEIPPLKEVRQQIVDQMVSEKQSETITAMLETLREGATIETHL